MDEAARPWLSILLPVYEVEPFIEACAASVLAQADEGVELVFVDDASPDGSAARLSALQAAHPARIRVLRHAQNQGISAARNSLLDAARGDYLWFVDPDDLMEAGALRSLKSLIAAHAPDLVMCDFRAFDDARPDVQRARYRHVLTFRGPSGQLLQDRELLLRGLFAEGQLHPWSKVVRRAIWPAALRFPAGRLFEDLAVYPRLALHVQRYVHSGQVWVAYRQRAGSALTQLGAARLDDWMAALAGYGEELRAALPGMTAGTRFEIAHFCARTFIRASKRSARLKLPAEVRRRYAAQWRSAMPLTPAQLLAAYLLRGRWLRALQLLYWLR